MKFAGKWVELENVILSEHSPQHLAPEFVLFIRLLLSGFGRLLMEWQVSQNKRNKEEDERRMETEGKGEVEEEEEKEEREKEREKVKRKKEKEEEERKPTLCLTSCI
ncbi:hypothetical protein STEG23_034669 [Scotinomys teguina]